jgi:hypothetical protein
MIDKTGEMSLKRVGHIVNGEVTMKDSVGVTGRFVDGGACFTCTYNYKMPHDEKAYLARRIVLALNTVRGLTNDQLERCMNGDPRKQ